MTPELRIVVSSDHAGLTLATIIRRICPQRSWSQVEKTIAQSAVCVNGVACLDGPRRLRAGDLIEIAANRPKSVRWIERIRLLHVDPNLAVVDKPSGLTTERRPEERCWSAKRKAIAPTLDELLPAMLAISRTPRRGKYRAAPGVILVHRLDRDTSGLLVVARTQYAADALALQFRKHSAQRVYRAVVAGHPGDVTIRTRLVRDRGDGLRGSVDSTTQGKEAVTHVQELERIGSHALIECRLETGRTNQIRIHLSEQNCPVSGDVKYNRRPDGTPFTDLSQAPRLALHATELEFVHPITQLPVRFLSPWPDDLERFVTRLRESHPVI